MQELIGNRYVVLREIGSGGMAWIYLAEDQTTGQRVALKVLFPQFAEDASYIQRFIREAKLAGALANPHIVRVLDYGADRDTYYLAMEYIEGETVREHLDRHGPYPWREALRLLCQAAEALEHAHHRGIIHRDIKPQNLMVTSDGVLKVLDFGVARVRDLPSLTQSGFVGSPYYASPEQVMGERVRPQSDLYSLGAVLYEMLTGEPPFRGEDPWSVISQHIATPPPALPPPPGPARVQILATQATAVLARVRGWAEGAPWRKWLPWAIGAVLLLLLVAAGVFVVRWQDARRVAQDYQKAVAHLEAGRPREALALLDQVLERDPSYRDAPALREQASRLVHLADLEAQAQAATVAGDWAEAIAAWTDLRTRAPGYRPAQVAEGLCAAYGGLGEAEATAFASGRGAEHLEKALQAFRRAQRECAPEKPQTWMATFDALRQYAAGQQAAAQGDWDGAIAAWQQAYAAQPGLADVAQRLYDALVARGWARAEAGDGEGARRDFAAALELDVPSRAEAQRGLAPDEFYSVTIMRKVGGEPRYWGHALRETQWKVSPLAGYGEADDDLFWWWVEVRKETGKDVDGKPMGPAISPKSEVRSFTWR